MEGAATCNADGITLKVSGRATIADADYLLQLLMKEFPPGSSVTIDLAGVTECDLSLFQLLCAVHKRSIRTSGSMNLLNCPGAVYETLISAGILRNHGCTGNDNDTCPWHEARKG